LPEKIWLRPLRLMPIQPVSPAPELHSVSAAALNAGETGVSLH
jgi:hypothetical protein